MQFTLTTVTFNSDNFVLVVAQRIPPHSSHQFKSGLLLLYIPLSTSMGRGSSNQNCSKSRSVSSFGDNPANVCEPGPCQSVGEMRCI